MNEWMGDTAEFGPTASSFIEVSVACKTTTSGGEMIKQTASLYKVDLLWMSPEMEKVIFS